MTFANFCVGIVVLLVILVTTFQTGYVFYWLNDECDETDIFVGGWMLSSIGLAICLTVILVQNGIV